MLMQAELLSLSMVQADVVLMHRDCRDSEMVGQLQGHKPGYLELLAMDRYF